MSSLKNHSLCSSNIHLYTYNAPGRNHQQKINSTEKNDYGCKLKFLTSYWLLYFINTKKIRFYLREYIAPLPVIGRIFLFFFVLGAG